VLIRAATVMCFVVIAGGALTFGAVYPWAYWPMAGLAAAAGLVMLLPGLNRGTGSEGLPLSGGLVGALSSIVVAGLLQLVPIPMEVLQQVSPGRIWLLENMEFSYAAGLKSAYSISVDPMSTFVAIILFVALALLFAGMTRALSVLGPRLFVEALTVFAVILALFGIVQKPLYSGLIYGFWAPVMGGSPFGPFVNKNHFAGWMLMALPLTLGLLCAGFERAMRGLKPGWRSQLLWFSSAEANRLILLAGAAAVMTLSLVLTMSRSGISALALSILLTGWLVLIGLPGRRRVAAVAFLVLLTVTAVSWVGADVLAKRFAKTDWSEFANRRGAWADAVAVVKAFPLTGTGLNTYADVSPFYQKNNLNYRFDESHNDYLQIAAEGGLLVSVPVALCLVVLSRDVFRRTGLDRGTTSWWLRRGAVTALVAIGLQETVEFSLQSPRTRRYLPSYAP
jgi:O-antigen ligase